LSHKTYFCRSFFGYQAAMKFSASSMITMIYGSIIALTMIALFLVTVAKPTEAVLLMRVTFPDDTKYNCSAADAALIALAIDADYYLGAPLKGDKVPKDTSKVAKDPKSS
jgi:hypothetical protein